MRTLPPTNLPRALTSTRTRACAADPADPPSGLSDTPGDPAAPGGPAGPDAPVAPVAPELPEAPTWTVRRASVAFPSPSTARTETGYAPGASNTCVTAVPDAAALPSPKSQSTDRTPDHTSRAPTENANDDPTPPREGTDTSLSTGPAAS
jgi:hypothetical protein